MHLPNLRFNGFTDSWQSKKLGEIFKISSGTTPSRNVNDYFDNGKHFWVKTTDLNNGLIIDTQEKVTDLALKKTSLKLFPKGSVLIAMYGGFNQIGRTGLLTADAAVNQALSTLLPSLGVINPYFLLSYLNFHVEDWKMFAASSRKDPNITKNDVMQFILNFPSLPEQTKIAIFIKAVDEKNAQLTQKSELLIQYKKGMMQKIFSQALRFKDDDGREFPEWDYVELEKVAAKVNKKNKEKSIRNVLTNSATQGIVSQSDYFDRDIANQNNLGGYYIVETDDFVYNPRISANALVGPIKRNHLTVGVMSPLYTVFRFTKGNLDFYEQYFQTNHWHDYMKSISNTGARHDRMNITNESFFGLPLPCPVEKEQLKIANFLTAIDDKITQTQAVLATMKQYKQGLLQQMFV